jgi:uncharacterized protein YbcI
VTDRSTADGIASDAISRGVVGLMRHYTGRGPTKTRTVIDPAMVVVFLEAGLTPGEQRLIQAGERSIVQELRATFQRTMRDELIALVEAHTGQRVRAFMSATNLDPDIACEIFVLHPPASKRSS